MQYGYVVEGFNDKAKVNKAFPDALCVVTKGTRMNGRVKMDVKEALSQCDQLVLLTDPDEAGDLLAEMVLKEFPTLTRVHLEREKCLCLRNRKWKVGVEHCDTDYLKEMLLKHRDETFVH